MKAKHGAHELVSLLPHYAARLSLEPLVDVDQLVVKVLNGRQSQARIASGGIEGTWGASVPDKQRWKGPAGFYEHCMQRNASHLVSFNVNRADLERASDLTECADSIQPICILNCRVSLGICTRNWNADLPQCSSSTLR